LDLAPTLANASDPASDVAQITPLMHAIFAEQSAIAQLLVQRGARVGVNSVRLVRAAANHGDEALTDLLLAHSADPASIGAGAWVQFPTIAEKLIARGAHVNQVPGAWIGMCCTGNSGHNENAALAQAMLRYGADVAARYKGNTALHCAAKAGFVNVATALIAYGADVNARNDRNQTPLDLLEHAGRSINTEPIRQLLLAHYAERSKP
jgi:cytohesin